MASIESRIDAFISEHDIDAKLKDDICVLVTGCMEDLFKHVFSETVPGANSTDKKAKKPADNIKLGWKPVAITNYPPMERKY